MARAGTSMLRLGLQRRRGSARLLPASGRDELRNKESVFHKTIADPARFP
jgi:hypothetical protein